MNDAKDCNHAKEGFEKVSNRWYCRGCGLEFAHLQVLGLLPMDATIG